MLLYHSSKIFLLLSGSQVGFVDDSLLFSIVLSCDEFLSNHMLLHIFGELKSNEVHHKEPHVLSGVISFKFVTVRWFLSILDKHSPYYLEKKDNLTFRSIVFDGKELNFSSGFDKLHTFAYEKILIGKGYGISQNRAVMKLLEEINTKSTTKPTHTFHPFMDIL